MTKRKSTLAQMTALTEMLTAPPAPAFRLPPLVECRDGVYTDATTGQVIGDEAAFQKWLTPETAGTQETGFAAVVIELTYPQTGPDLTEPNKT